MPRGEFGALVHGPEEMWIKNSLALLKGAWMRTSVRWAVRYGSILRGRQGCEKETAQSQACWHWGDRGTSKWRRSLGRWPHLYAILLGVIPHSCYSGDNPLVQQHCSWRVTCNMKFKFPQIFNQGDCWLGTWKEQREKGKERTKKKDEGQARTHRGVARGGRSGKADTHRQKRWVRERDGRPGWCGWRGWQGCRSRTCHSSPNASTCLAADVDDGRWDKLLPDAFASTS